MVARFEQLCLFEEPPTVYDEFCCGDSDTNLSVLKLRVLAIPDYSVTCNMWQHDDLVSYPGHRYAVTISSTRGELPHLGSVAREIIPEMKNWE
ncbi:hypothetical protein QIO84_gp4 [ssRNA phage Gephyllon.4_16]|uniref:Uncharacterized protein n=2 Tax=Leviviricetes TaxID=2842243 RepID=A0A8S5L2N2_9VIRU|nr:hypothetical protein QIO84_gp4 [ssRNA phage Gephyllon.4_16]QDH91019.1 MAG: hypothetical protein H4BulkLitter24221_000002 [Leviviridae sp.]DAD51402.1 TPA_asm: hypothetical protein [ssRNA phage Gephyllon.4_16]